MNLLTQRAALVVFIFLTALHEDVSAQCQPFIKVDGKMVIANETVPSGVRFPIWLKANQTLACGLTIDAISVIEFTENGSTLEYSQVLSVTSQTPVSVPAGKVWKIESILKRPIISGGTNKVEYTQQGNSTFTVPSCAEYICIEVWGAGGGGQANQITTPWPGGAGGGGGSYGQECFTVVPGTVYTVIVGAGGAGGSAASLSAGSAGGTTSVVGLISAGGGAGGTGAGGSGSGAGGTSTAAVSIPGFNGLPGCGSCNGSSYVGGTGGNGANGGLGGVYVSNNGTTGGSPGGGGSGGGGGSTQRAGGQGGPGKVVITW